MRRLLRIARVHASRHALLLLAAIAGAAPLAAQESFARAADNPDRRVARIVVEPALLDVRVGESVRVAVSAIDSSGQPVPDAQVLGYLQSAEASWDPESATVRGLEPGRTHIAFRVRRPVGDIGYDDVWGRVDVRVLPARPVGLEIEPPPGRLYVGTHTRLRARPVHSAARAATAAQVAALRIAQQPGVDWRSSDPSVLDVGPGGVLRAGRIGTATIVATSDGVRDSVRLEVVGNPIRSIDLDVDADASAARVGDVLRVRATPRTGAGAALTDAIVEWSTDGLDDQPWDALYLEEEPGGVLVVVPNEPGRYRVTASLAAARRDLVLDVAPRPARREMRRVAHGVVPSGQSTTDLWVFEGLDGRDYVYTGTYSGNLMYAWDVTEPSSPVITDSVRFDGRRVNDVKINEARTIAVVTSEHAANRRNGFTLLDIRDPAHPRTLAHHTENLTGGVHNTWITGDLVYAVHYGTRALHIVDIADPRAPREVGRWELPNDDRFLHDVNVQDGLAYLSYWNDGVVVLDVGDGRAGGTPIEPQLVTQFTYAYRLGPEIYGNTHHAVRWGDYVFAGDEIFDCVECVNGARGYIHVFDVSDMEAPREVAWYRVPEAGSHNMWAEDGRLYIGYYQGGLRVVDITGELRGDLYRQGREIGWFAESESTWGAQPYQGLIYASDGGSGLWIVEMTE